MNPGDPRGRDTELEFYSSYDWCLNPFPRLSELLELTDKEIRRLRERAGSWESREVRINLHLFAGAISCLIDDYLSWLPLQLQPLMYRLGNRRMWFVLLERMANSPYLITACLQRKQVQQWRTRWTKFVDEIHDLLLSQEAVTQNQASSLLRQLCEFRDIRLPARLLDRRMKIIEGYRCQDLTHHDICTLAQRYMEFNPDRTTETFIIGPRTAGAYFAPVVSAYLVRNGYKYVSWMTVRPKRGFTTGERKEMRRHAGPNVRCVLTDDHSSTGLTFALLQEELSRMGVQPSQITLLAPIHPRRPHVSLAVSPETRVIKLLHTDLHKRRTMDSPEQSEYLEGLIRRSLSPGAKVTVRESPETAQINDRFWKQTADSFQVRLKHVYDVHVHPPQGHDRPMRVLAKSVGWGWLGYHACIAGTKLHNAVPRVLGLRDGMLFMEWIDQPPGAQRETGTDLQAEQIGKYVAFRREALRLNEDPRFFGPEYGWGWQEIVSLLRRPYGIRSGYLKNHILYQRLREHTSPAPMLVDGRMFPIDWLHDGEKLIKSDFEHHNFGPPNLEMADPAFDLAGAAFELGLSVKAESTMLDAYRKSSLDESIDERLVLYKLLYARVVQRLAHVELLSKDSVTTPVHNHARYARSWDFLVLTMMRSCARMMNTTRPFSRSGNVLYLDIDGVLDTGIFGFPHTTPRGLAALALLRQAGYSVVPNSGRSVLHIREYCRSFGFEGGVGEYGSVIVRTKDDEEIPLASPAALEQIAECRTKLKNLPGVFFDPSYRFAIRAYRFGSGGTFGLSRTELEELLERNKFTLLRVISHQSDSYIVSREVDKGRAALAFNELLGYHIDRVAAMGNSDDDLPMLSVAGVPFAPKNSSRGVREFARQGKCRIVRQPNQSGLLEAVKFLTRSQKPQGGDKYLHTGDPGSLQSLIFTIMQRTDQSRLRRFLVLLRRNAL